MLDTDPSPPPEPAPTVPTDEWGNRVLDPGQCLCQPADEECGCVCEEGTEW